MPKPTTAGMQEVGRQYDYPPNEYTGYQLRDASRPVTLQQKEQFSEEFLNREKTEGAL